MDVKCPLVGGLDSGALSEAAGVWHWDGPITAAPRLVELVEAGLGELDAGERDLVELLAFGEPLDAGLLERMVPAPVLTAAERKGLFSVQRTCQQVDVRVAHPLYGEVVRAQTSALRARVVHRPSTWWGRRCSAWAASRKPSWCWRG